MQTYKYQSVLPTGVAVFGVFDADSEAALEEYLLTRGMTLVTWSVVAIDKRLGTPLAAIPRVLQLRIGERIQEAMLTGLPAHVAIEAMAKEPFEHPLLMTMPWLSGMAGCARVVSFAWRLLCGNYRGAPGAGRRGSRARRLCLLHN